MSGPRVKKNQKLFSIDKTRISNVLEGKSAKVDKRFKEGLPIISCKCGAEILVVPDLQAMNRAIKTHASEHRKKERNTKNNVFTPGKISQLLSQLTLVKMSKQNET
jgi:hypothetical protein